MTTTITVRGKTYHVSHDQPVRPEYEFETPYLLVPANGRGQTLRLLRNKPNPKMLFAVGENFMSKGGMPNLWFKEVAPGDLVPAC